MVNSRLDAEGVGIDENCYAVVDDEEVVSSTQLMADSGLDSNFGTFADGGIVYAVGTSMDLAEEDSEQPTMYLDFQYLT